MPWPAPVTHRVPHRSRSAPRRTPRGTQLDDQPRIGWVGNSKLARVITLPSGKFDTNYLVCQLAALAMNILRLMGQRGLLGPDAPVRHSAKRRRIKTVMQELIYRAARLIEHARRIVLGLGANDRAATVFTRMHAQFAATS